MSQIIVVVGSNWAGEFGLNHTDDIEDMVNFTTVHGNKHIESIYCGYKYTIYANDNHSALYAAGINEHSQCCIQHQDNDDDDDDDGCVSKLSEINYFQWNKIKIKRVCTNPTSDCTVWISNEGKAYGSGCNNNHELGVERQNDKPQLIPSLLNAMDVQFGEGFGVALCSNDREINDIISSWSRNASKARETLYIPEDIRNVIVAFAYITSVYSTANFAQKRIGRRKRPKREEKYNDDDIHWKEILELSKTKIVKISGGMRHALFLDFDGNLWASGQNKCGELGNGKSMNSWPYPFKIEYFERMKISVREIKCGGYHNLCVDRNNKVYSWGFNADGQCGDGRLKAVMTPSVIPALIHYDVGNIGCGFWHSYVGTMCGKHFLFGNNESNECIFADTNIYPSKVKIPHLINEVIEQKYKNMSIKSVHLGFESTKVVLVSKNK